MYFQLGMFRNCPCSENMFHIWKHPVGNEHSIHTPITYIKFRIFIVNCVFLKSHYTYIYILIYMRDSIKKWRD